MKSLVCLVLFLMSSVTAINLVDFNQWISKYNKEYLNQGEYERRFQIFVDHAKLVEQHNSEDYSWKLELNQFADLTNQEFHEYYLMEPQMYNYIPKNNNLQTVPEIDWRTKGAVTPVKDQGLCGSCYAFSSTGSLEGCLKLATGNLISLSEQEFVDCTMSYGNSGCDGGWMDNCFKYTIDHGDANETAYPYKYCMGTCKSNIARTIKITGYIDVPATEASLQNAVAGRPVSVSIDASLESFQLYKFGSYCPSGCSTTNLDHAVLVVGMTNNYSAGGDYIVKNSWGISWGDEGYIYMCANQNNHCGIATKASYPIGCTR